MHVGTRERTMAQDKFMFFPNFKSMADKLNPETRLAFYDALTDYVFFDKEPSDPIISALIEAIKPSLNKIDGRRNNGGNHNPNGVNQHSKGGQSGQIRSKLVNSGQFLSETETETETETEKNIFTKGGVGEKETFEKQADENFERFWSSYTPVKTTDGRVVSKGSRKEAQTKYLKLVKSGVNPNDILSGLNSYIQHCQRNNQLTCGATVFLNQERWKDDYSPTTALAQQRMPQMSLKEMQELQKEIEIQKILNGER